MNERKSKHETKLAHELREILRVLLRRLGTVEKSEMPCCGITLGQCHALIEVGRAKEISLIELSAVLGLDNSTMSRTVNNLVNNGLVRRTTDSEDRRYVKLLLTDKGFDVFKGIEKNMEDYFAGILRSIPENKRVEVIESLKILESVIKDNKCC